MENKKQREKQDKKKVLQIVTKSNFGGAQHYVYELSKKLKENDFDVVVAFGGEGLLKEKLQKEGVRTRKIKSLVREISILNDLKSFFGIIKVIRKERPDVAHLNSSKIGAIGSIAARLCFVPRIIFTIHGLAYNENRSWLSKNIIKFIYLLAIFFSHKSIAVSENVRRSVTKIPLGFIIKNKVITIKNGIDKINFIERDEARSFISNHISKNIDLQDKKIIGTIAELHHIKGIDYLIDSAPEILAKNPEAIFVVFGDGDEKENLRRKIKEKNLEKKFFLLGFVDNAPKYLKALDLFVLPSIYEALALVILEAKQAGIKIAASNAGGIPEAISDYQKAILFEPKNPESISEAILKILEKDFIEIEDQDNGDNLENNHNNLAEDSIGLMYQKTVSAYQRD